MEPYRTKKGMFEKHFNQEVQLPSFKKQSNDSSNVVIQGLQREKLYPGLFLQESASAKTAEKGTKTVAEKVVEEEGRREVMQAEGRTETRTIYLVMPSYAEQHKHQIAVILEKEKKNLCRSKTFEKVFSSINFKIAFANSKNIKQMIVRTKI